MAKGTQVKRIPISYDPAPEVEKYAKPLIGQYHKHLVSCKIAYLFKNKDIKMKGREVVATAEKISTKNKVLSGYDFIITVAYPKWKNLDESIRIAVIDHELSHCWVEEDEKTGDTKIKILPHDVEEFGEIIKRHGLYTVNLVKLGNLVSDKIKNIKLGDPDSDLDEDAEDAEKIEEDEEEIEEEIEEDEEEKVNNEDEDDEDLFEDD